MIRVFTYKRFGPAFFLLLSLTACGGRDYVPSGQQTAQYPVSVSLYTDGELIASGDTITLSWESDAESCVASGGWSGSKSPSGSELIGPLTQDTEFFISCRNKPKESISNALASVAIMAESFVSPTVSTVVSDSGRRSLAYVRYNYKLNDLLWDEENQVLLLATAADSPTDPNSLISFDPVTGSVVDTLTFNESPKHIAISTDGQYIYVVLGLRGIQRVMTSNLEPDIVIPVPGGDNEIVAVVQVAVSPANSETIAVLGQLWDEIGRERYGVTIFDNAVARGSVFHDPFIHWMPADINWTMDGSAVYASSHGNSPFFELTVTEEGLVNEKSSSAYGLSGGGRLFDSTFYTVAGYVFSLEGDSPYLVGRLPDYRSPDYYDPWWRREISLTRGKIFSVTRNLTPEQYADGVTLYATDPEQFTIIDTITFNGDALTNAPYSVVWGADGIALYDSRTPEFIVARGSFAAAVEKETPLKSVPVAVSGRVTGASSSLSFKVFNVGATDVVYDSCDNLFITTSSVSSFHPNSVVKFDISNGLILDSAFAGSAPGNLEVSDDCSTLYVGLDGSWSISRFLASNLTHDATIKLGQARARSISVAPGYPNTLAVAKKEAGGTQCEGSTRGLSVYDGHLKRPTSYYPSSHSIMSTAWGETSDTLYGADNDYFYSFTVDETGVYDSTSLFSTKFVSYLYDLARVLYFDRDNGRLISSWGKVYDTALNKDIGTINLKYSASVDAICGTPMGAITTDSMTGKIFHIASNPGSSVGGVGVASYDNTTLELIDSVAITSRFIARHYGYPVRAVRSAPDEIVYITNMGELVLLKGDMLLP